MARLSPTQAAYLLGLRRAHTQIKRELDALASELRDTFDELHDELRNELRGLRADLARLRAINTAVDTERDMDARLN
jgi:hypothetical protein